MKYPILYTVLILTLVFIGGFVSVGEAQTQMPMPTMTLDDCIETGMENNPSLKAAEFNLSSAEQEVKVARADFLPAITSGYSINTQKNESARGTDDSDYLDQKIRSFNIKLTQILYAGSRITNTYEKARIMEKVAKAQLALEKLELVYNIESTFFRVMKAEQDVVTVTESVNRLLASNRSAQAFFDKELIAYVDVLQAKVDLADAEEQLGVAKNNLNRERVALLYLMDLPFDSKVEFTLGEYSAPADEVSFETSLAYALENRPDIKNLEYQLEATRTDEKIAMAKYLPTIRADAGYYDRDRKYTGDFETEDPNRDQRNRYWSAGIYATWELFDGGRAWYGKERYKSNVRKIKALIKETKNMLSTGIHNALYSMSEAEQRSRISAETLVAAKEYYTREERRLKAGLSTIPALLEAQNRLIRAQVNKNRALLDYRLAESELKFMTGERLLKYVEIDGTGE